MIISSYKRSICFFLVSGFFTDVVEQIHSLRASGVRSFQASNTAELEVRAFCKSSGTSWTTPVAISFLFISNYHFFFWIAHFCHLGESVVLGAEADGGDDFCGEIEFSEFEDFVEFCWVEAFHWGDVDFSN